MTKEQQEEFARLEMAVDEFAIAMKERLKAKLTENGWRGWDDPQYAGDIYMRLQKNVSELGGGRTQSCIDAANLTMMLWRGMR